MVNSGIWKPSTTEQSKKLAGPCEITNLALKSGGPAFVSFYDGVAAQDAVAANLRWVLDAAAANPDREVFESGLVFRKGVFAVCEQGWDLNPVVCIATNLYSAV